MFERTSRAEMGVEDKKKVRMADGITSPSLAFLNGKNGISKIENSFHKSPQTSFSRLPSHINTFFPYSPCQRSD